MAIWFGGAFRFNANDIRGHAGDDWGDDSYSNSLALNVQITYLRRFLAPDASVEIVALK